MAAIGALGIGVRFITRRFSYVASADEGVSVFPVLNLQLQTLNCDLNKRVFESSQSSTR